MAHPHKKEVSDSHNAKLQKMTRHYGDASGPANNIKSPSSFLKEPGPEDSVGFGADYAAASARSDKPARKSMAANPVPTYRRGGAAKHTNGMKVAGNEGGARNKIGGMVSEANGGSGNAHSKIHVTPQGQPPGRARGGRLHGKGKGTHVNVIVAPQGGNQPPAGGPSPQLAALAGGAHPPMPMPPPGPPPGGPPMGGPPMGGPPGMPPGGPPMMPPRKRGGKVMKHDDEKEDKALIKQTLSEEGLIRKAKGGGIHLTAGAASGVARLEKLREQVPVKPVEIASKGR